MSNIGYSKYLPPFTGNHKNYTIKPPSYLLDPYDTNLKTILMISNRYDDDWYLFQQKLHIVRYALDNGIKINLDDLFYNDKITAS